MSSDNGWLDKMVEEEPAAREKWPVGAVWEPTGPDGRSDANLFYADLLADSDPTFNPYSPQYRGRPIPGVTPAAAAEPEPEPGDGA
jgi:hypothetical protein